MRFIAPIVEGHGEAEAVPVLLQRMAQGMNPASGLRVNPPIRVRAGSFIRDRAYFDRYVALAAAKAAQAQGSVLILLDCEDHCPATLGPRLLADALQVRNDVHIIVALAYREFETWFVTAAHSLRGMRGLPPDLRAPAAPERIRDAKGWLGSRMQMPYDPVIHQCEFVRRFDIAEACANRSFRRFYERISATFVQA